MSANAPLPEQRPTFEDRVAASIHTLTVTAVVLGAFLLLAIGLAVYGFSTADTARSSASIAARTAARVAQRQAAVTREIAASANARAVSAQELAQAIATDRSATILRECEAVNARHRATITELDRIINQFTRHAGRAQRRQLAASRRFSALIIDRLAPLSNCQRTVAIDNSPAK